MKKKKKVVLQVYLLESQADELRSEAERIGLSMSGLMVMAYPWKSLPDLG